MSEPIVKPRPAAGLPGFKPLSKRVHVQEVDTPVTDANPTDPTTVLIYGWGDAQPKHVAKYVDGYKRLFPHAKQVLVFSPILPALYQPLSIRSRDMKPVVEAVHGGASIQQAGDSTEEKNTEERVLVHVMSNTGGISCAATLHAFNEHYPSSQFPHQMLVLDSTPGSHHFFPNIARWSRAMALGVAAYLPWPFVVTQALAASFLGLSHLAVWLIPGQISTAEYSTAVVNDPSLSDIRAQRLYLYSKEDDIIHWEDIEFHAADAKAKGYVVSAEIFEGTPHVGHMRQYPEQYWSAIAKAWKDTTTANNVAGQ
ncbi:hypothetical protein B0H63DRAFT_219650 [Podospora didyma]|uniref:DUF829-domain-containing protein n=1 Tax=Podospora didyma TaxID=330526 RepID=A0AAE0KIU9_9PEZI|nr:hypothetical protein B0H63DRAFT_219650 [Podospora didyma]